MKRALMAEFGVIHTSDYVVDEAVVTALARTRNHQIAVNTGRHILDSERIEKTIKETLHCRRQYYCEPADCYTCEKFITCL